VFYYMDKFQEKINAGLGRRRSSRNEIAKSPTGG